MSLPKFQLTSKVQGFQQQKVSTKALRVPHIPSFTTVEVYNVTNLAT